MTTMGLAVEARKFYRGFKERVAYFSQCFARGFSLLDFFDSPGTLIHPLELAAMMQALGIENNYQNTHEFLKTLPITGGQMVERTMVLLRLYRQSGCREYEVGPGATQRFLLTDLRGIKNEDFKAPYEAFSVWLPSGFLEAHGQEIVGFMLSHKECSDGHVWMCATIARHEMVSIQMFTFENGKTVRESLDDFAATPCTCGHCDPDEYIAEEEQHVRWLTNFLFYVTRPDASLYFHEENRDLVRLQKRLTKARGKKREKIREQIKDQVSNRVIVVGRDIVLDKTLPVTSREARGALKVRTLVAGHWQRYHVGEQRADVVWKFRNPFWRGPEAGVEGTSMHEVR